MKISELIKTLEEFKAKRGDLTVKHGFFDDDFLDIEYIDTTSEEKEDGSVEDVLVVL